jgi:F1-F0 ATPase (N-ATPase) AtpR subunit
MAMDAWTMSGAMWIVPGLLGGAAYFALLRWNTLLYVGAQDHARFAFVQALGLQLLRLGGIGVLLGFAARDGALPLLFAALGVMVCRPLVLHVARVTS